MLRLMVGVACLGVSWGTNPAAADDGAGTDAGQGPWVLPFEVPWTDRAPQVETFGGQAWITVAVVGQPDPRAQRLAVKRSTARDRAEARARDALHRWVDDALARILARPQVAAAGHAAVHRQARVLGVRPLTDGAAVVVAGVPATALREAVPAGGVPWAR